MQKLLKIYWIALALICLQMLCCCSSSDNEEQPTQPHDITGVWLEYAYLCSDGYFVDISNTGYNMYYEFVQPNIFNQYEIIDGDKNYHTQGTWTFDNISNVAKVIEPRGWNLDIRFEFISDNDATLHITGRTTTSNMTIKARRINK